MIKVKTVELRKNLQHYINLALSGEEVVLEYKGGVEITLQPKRDDPTRLTQAQKILAYFNSPEHEAKIRPYKESLAKIPTDPKKLKELIAEQRYQDYLDSYKDFNPANLVMDKQAEYKAGTSNSALLDTNIVVDLIIKRERHAKIAKLLTRFDYLLITTSTYLTAFYVLRKFDTDFETVRNSLFQYNLIEIPPRICYHAANLAKSKDDVEDCALLLSAKENRSVLVTADKELLQKYGQVHHCLLID